MSSSSKISPSRCRPRLRRKARPKSSQNDDQTVSQSRAQKDRGQGWAARERETIKTAGAAQSFIEQESCAEKEQSQSRPRQAAISGFYTTIRLNRSDRGLLDFLLDVLLDLLLDLLAPLRRALARLLRLLLIAEPAKDPREEVAAAGIIAATAEEALLARLLSWW